LEAAYDLPRQLKNKNFDEIAENKIQRKIIMPVAEYICRRKN
jgi:hypothetical protein